MAIASARTRSTPGQILDAPSVRTQDNGFIEADYNTLNREGERLLQSSSALILCAAGGDNPDAGAV